MILNRLGVRGKLNLLLLLPLTAVVLVAVPFMAGQVGNARSAATTADAARHARELGGLVWELQRERLLTAGYLASPSAERVPLLLQQRAVSDAADSVRTSLGPGASDELLGALVRLDSLKDLRQSVLQRGASLDSVARAYHAVIDAVIDALRLATQRSSDAEGTRQLNALDALLRANEQSSLRGMALIAAAVSPQIGEFLLNDASAQSQMFTERFVQQADVDQAGLVVLVDQGEAARRVDALVQRLPDARARGTVPAFIADAVASVDSQASLRRLVQDRVTSKIADAAASRAGAARGAAWAVGTGTAVLFFVVAALAVVVSRSIADPLRRLTRAATTVADLANTELVRVTDMEGIDEQPPQLAAINVSSGDEVGELAVAFNRVQATAAMLLERQIITRRNVSMMFANVAQRTQNLVNRQLALVDELERNEQDPTLLSSLYRLDHLSTRLRRNAENLLVVAGSRDETRIAGPTPLATVLRSALAEIEDYQRVRISDLSDGTVASPLVSDLILVFAELLENATVFSPPESFVDVHAKLFVDGGCQVFIVDNGIGMAARRLAEENGRLLERERLDIAPTSVLGLFVVGRLARRHGLKVELVASPNSGITAKVAIPPALFFHGGVRANAGMSESARTTATLARRPAIPPPVIIPVAGSPNDGFSWFAPKPDDYSRTAAASQEPAAFQEPAASQEPAADSESSRPGLNRRVPGAQVPNTAPLQQQVSNPPAARSEHDAAAARDAMDAYQSAISRAVSSPPPQRPQPPQPPQRPSMSPMPPPSLPPQRPVSPLPGPPRTPSPVSAPAASNGPGPYAGASSQRFPGAQSPIPDRSGGRDGLARRVPGAQLAPSLRDQPAGIPPLRETPRPTRDPEAERAAFDAYTSGLARAIARTDTAPNPHDHWDAPTRESEG
jgi:signal transduction histidine kinase